MYQLLESILLCLLFNILKFYLTTSGPLALPAIIAICVWLAVSVTLALCVSALH
jgi:hypothetical protein